MVTREWSISTRGYDWSRWEIIKSAASYNSGINAWKQFAVKVFGYDPEYALPPSCSKHVRAFICTFRCHGTAANYVTHIRWACNSWELHGTPQQ